MEEERKKKKDQMKERDKIRKKMQAQNQRGEIKPEKIKPLAVYNIYFYRYHFHFSKIRPSEMNLLISCFQFSEIGKNKRKRRTKRKL